MTRDIRDEAEALYERIGGDLCICQRGDVPHWCETCQRRIDMIQNALLRAPASCTLEEGCRCAACARKCASETQERGWQDIATAPRDGTDVIIATEGGVVGEARWVDEKHGDGGTWWWAAAEPIYGDAAAWQPMPSPPSQIEDSK